MAVPERMTPIEFSALIFRQRAQKGIDRHALASRLLGDRELQHAVENGHLAVGWNHIDMVGGDGYLIQRFHHRHRGAALEDFRQEAFMAGIEMGNQHKGHAGIFRTGTEKRFERLQPAGGSADADNGQYRKRCLRGFFRGFCSFLFWFPGYHGLRLLNCTIKPTSS